jgi:ABC-type transport system substrate-binding protein
LRTVEKTNYLWIIIPIALLVGALVGGLITYFSGLSKLNTETPTPTPVATAEPTSVEPTPTASPSSTLKRDVLKVQVLNGSGVSGAANKAKALLETAGYKNVDTGNASMNDLTQTEVAVKDIKKEYLDLIVKDLAKSYDATEAAKPLVVTSKYDIVITLGKK